MKDKELEFLKSDEFKDLFKQQVIKNTWDKDLPKIYIKNSKIIKHYKDGRKEIIKDNIPLTL